MIYYLITVVLFAIYMFYDREIRYDVFKPFNFPYFFIALTMCLVWPITLVAIFAMNWIEDLDL